MLESFENFLSLKGKVNGKYIPFYLKWVTEGRSLQTTMIYTHVATKNVLGVRSLLDK